jgi:uridylate kinase
LVKTHPQKASDVQIGPADISPFRTEENLCIMDATSTTPYGPPVFRRVLLKLSGESFCRPGEGGINVDEVSRIARQASRVAACGVELAIVVGGGNILRGASLKGSNVVKEATAHYMGMMATVINGLALQDALEGLGCETRLLTTIRMDEVAEPFIRRRALSHLSRGRVVVLATGTGSPFVTTDTAAALKGKELGAEVLLKATRVDGIYSADPEKNPHAVRYDRLTYEQVLRDELKVMDLTAIGMCFENALPILVFNFKKEGNIERAIAGEAIGTWVSNSARPVR